MTKIFAAAVGVGAVGYHAFFFVRTIQRPQQHAVFSQRAVVSVVVPSKSGIASAVVIVVIAASPTPSRQQQACGAGGDLVGFLHGALGASAGRASAVA